MAASGTLVIRFIGDLKEFERATASIGKRLHTTGKAMTMGLTLPIVAAGAAAVKMAMDFEDSMSKLRGLVGASEADVRKFSKVILTDGPKWGKAPSELADALYFISSSGYKGAQALDILKTSAMASSAGLGDTKTVADLLTSAISAYGIKNLTATQAADALAQAVKKGKLESSEMAGVLGNVIPIASQMGVSFQEVAGTLSALSLTGTNATKGATMLRGILSSLLKPTTAANKQLEDMGLSAQGLRDQMDKKGLLSVLETLKTKFKGNTSATAAVFGNVRALTGVMSLMGGNVDKTRSIFDAMNHSTGTMDKAFEEASKTTQFKMNKAIAELKATLIEVGLVILPVVATALNHVSTFLENARKAWNGLDDGTKHVILTALGFLAAVGPVLLLLGKIAMIVSALANPVGLVVTAVVLLAAAFAGVAIHTDGLAAGLAKVFAPFTSGKFVAALSATGAALMAFLNQLMPTLIQVGNEIDRKSVV